MSRLVDVTFRKRHGNMLKLACRKDGTGIFAEHMLSLREASNM